MARIYWTVLDCGTERECCCKCPDLYIDEDNRSDQTCCNLGIIDLPVENRKIECCETPLWCPLPKLEFPPEAKSIISVSPIFE